MQPMVLTVQFACWHNHCQKFRFSRLHNAEASCSFQRLSYRYAHCTLKPCLSHKPCQVNMAKHLPAHIGRWMLNVPQGAWVVWCAGLTWSALPALDWLAGAAWIEEGSDMALLRTKQCAHMNEPKSTVFPAQSEPIHTLTSCPFHQCSFNQCLLSTSTLCRTRQGQIHQHQHQCNNSLKQRCRSWNYQYWLMEEFSKLS